MSALQFPCTIFKTQKGMDDYSASDMGYGDLSEVELKTHYRLVDVSTRANPYTLTKITLFNQPQSMFHGSRSDGRNVTRKECATILFDEFRHLSQLFSIYGPYSHLIENMITHMQNGNGSPFDSISLNSALKAHIIRDKTENSTLLRIKEIIENILTGAVILIQPIEKMSCAKRYFLENCQSLTGFRIVLTVWV